MVMVLRGPLSPWCDGGLLQVSHISLTDRALTKNAADELGGSGMNVSGVSPGLVRTEATPRVLGEQAAQQGLSVDQLEARIGDAYAIGRMVSADEVAAVVTWLASPLSVAVTGDVIACGGGAKGSIYY